MLGRAFCIVGTLLGSVCGAVSAAGQPVDALVFADSSSPSFDLDPVCLALGGGTFNCTALPTNPGASFDVAFAFIDDNVNADLVFAQDGANEFCSGDGSGGFVCTDISSDMDLSMAVATAQLNPSMDSHLDLVFANFGSANTICFGDGNGGFSCGDIAPSDGLDNNNSVAVGHINPATDAHPDVLFVKSGNNQQCFGTSAAEFVCFPNSTFMTSLDVALGDLNGDGIADAVLANGVGTDNQVCIGDGFSLFSNCASVIGPAVASFGVALGRVNGDAHLDAVFANTIGGVNQVCLGDGMGGLCCDPIEMKDFSSVDVALAHIDDDSNLDAVFANQSFTEPERVCFGDGNGDFTCGDFDSSSSQSLGVAAGHLLATIFADSFEAPAP